VLHKIIYLQRFPQPNTPLSTILAKLPSKPPLRDSAQIRRSRDQHGSIRRVMRATGNARHKQIEVEAAALVMGLRHVRPVLGSLIGNMRKAKDLFRCKCGPTRAPRFLRQ
jgi:hypothetical protein